MHALHRQVNQGEHHWLGSRDSAGASLLDKQGRKAGEKVKKQEKATCWQRYKKDYE